MRSSRESILRLSSFWFLYLGALGIFFPYFTLYLNENAGLGGREAGVVLAIVPLVGLVAQPLWGQIADLTGRRVGLLVFLTWAAALGHWVLGRLEGFGSIVIGAAFVAAFASAVIPNGAAVSLASLGVERAAAFGRVRVWGTVGFLAVVVVFPWILDATQAARGLEPVPGGPSEPGLEVMFAVTAILVALSGVVLLGLPATDELGIRAKRGDWRELLRNGPFVRYLSFTFVAYGFLQGPMAFFPVWVRAQGGTLDDVSRMWVLMLLPEIPLVAGAGAVLRRLGPRGLVVLGVVAGGVRWTLCGVVESFAVLYALQCLHGFVVAGILIGGMLYVDAAVPERLRSSGQGALAMLGLGVGGMVSNLAAGWLLESYGPRAPYLLGGLGALALAALAPVWLVPAPASSGDGADRRSL